MVPSASPRRKHPSRNPMPSSAATVATYPRPNRPPRAGQSEHQGQVAIRRHGALLAGPCNHFREARVGDGVSSPSIACYIRICNGNILKIASMRGYLGFRSVDCVLYADLLRKHVENSIDARLLWISKRCLTTCYKTCCCCCCPRSLQTPADSGHNLV